jgi:uncharacterized membrane protein
MDNSCSDHGHRWRPGQPHWQGSWEFFIWAVPLLGLWACQLNLLLIFCHPA